MKLLILESPGKIKTIKRFLGPDYQVMASIGHIRILDRVGKHKLGIDVEGDFTPSYSNDPSKKDVIKNLRAAAKSAEQVILATDGDLEGEAIAWHLQEVLKVPKSKLSRITFNEITEKAVKEALKNPRQIDSKKVDAQETRRLLDRIVGFRLSGLAISKLGAKSAGRVQSAALKILVDRELEIRAFVPKVFYEIRLPFNKDNKDYIAKYKGTDAKKIVSIPTKQQADKVVKESVVGKYTVGNIESKDRGIKSKPPYTTSTFQQEISSRLGYGSKKAMQIAQSLYEGININGEHYGLISYMRTDSVRLSDEFISNAKVLIEKKYGKKYYSGKINVTGKKANGVQDAHEGIRPTHLEFTPAYVKPFLSTEQYKVYELIYRRALSALMSDANVKDTEVTINNGIHRYGIKGTEVVFDGFLKVYKEFKEGDDEDGILPTFKLGEKIKDSPLLVDKRETSPPSRYSEASLIKRLEELGIGRPSTYTSIVETLKGRDYTTLEKKALVPSDKGIDLIKMLETYFDSIVNPKYSAEMEEKLDKIAAGKLDKLTELKEFYNVFEPNVLKAHREINKDKPEPEQAGKDCPKCGAPLVIRTSKFGQFYACSKFPKCKYTEQKADPNKPAAPVAVQPAILQTCPVCQKGKLMKRIASKGPSVGSAFYACNQYPKCKTTFSEQEYIERFLGATGFSDTSTDSDID